MHSKKNESAESPQMIDTPSYSGPDRRKPRRPVAASQTSVRLRFTADGRSLWEAATVDSEHRVDEETARLLADLNDGPRTEKTEEEPPGEDTIMRRMIVGE